MAYIKNYSLYLDGGDDKEYVRTYDGAIEGKRAIKHLIAQIEYYEKKGVVPIVAVFVPKDGE